MHDEVLGHCCTYRHRKIRHHSKKKLKNKTKREGERHRDRGKDRVSNEESVVVYEYWNLVFLIDSYEN